MASLPARRALVATERYHRRRRDQTALTAEIDRWKGNINDPL
jgi:hypothetical protein